jgi:hypothetical protein
MLEYSNGSYLSLTIITDGGATTLRRNRFKLVHFESRFYTFV